MNHKLLTAGLASLAFSLGSVAPAHAGIGACGDIHVDGNAQCQIEVEGGCTVQCTPVSFQAACAAELHASCSAECTGSASVECTGSCDVASCEARCDVDPGDFSCEGECSAQAEAHCAGECQAAADRGKCEASCKATFSGSCEASCQGQGPTADCRARCEASCEGSCQAEANVECQVDCQARADGFATCEARMQGACEAACSSPEGALFCDGQFVDHGGKLNECIDALEAYLKAHVDVSARGSATSDCVGNSCSASAEGSAEASCSYGALPPVGSGSLLGGLAALGMTWVRRRRR